MRRILCTVAAVALGFVLVPSLTEARTCPAGHRTSAACAKAKSHAAKAKSRVATAPSEHGSKAGKRTQKVAAKKPVDPHAPALDATTLACNDEYEANKAAIDGGGQSRAKFIKDCRNGTETIPGGVKTGAAPAAVTGPPPDKPLPPADPKSGRPIVMKGDQTGSTGPKR